MVSDAIFSIPFYWEKLRGFEGLKQYIKSGNLQQDDYSDI